MRWRRRREPGWQRAWSSTGRRDRDGHRGDRGGVDQVPGRRLDGRSFLIPLLILMFRAIHAHYSEAADELAAQTPLDPDEITTR